MINNTDIGNYLYVCLFVCFFYHYYFCTKGDEESKDNTTLQFDLKVKCIKNKNAPKNATDPDELFINSKGMLYCRKEAAYQVIQLGCTILGYYTF